MRTTIAVSSPQRCQSNIIIMMRIPHHWLDTFRIFLILLWSSVSTRTLCSDAFILPYHPSRLSKSQQFFHHRQRSSLLPLSSSSSLGGSNNSNSNEDVEAMEAIQSLIDFHEGGWEGRANSFSVTPDIAAGIVQRKVSSKYNVAVTVKIDNDRRFSLTETISMDDTVTLRTLPLHGCNMDVDSVDGSYSLDSSSTTEFPTELSGTDKQPQFIIEHCIAAGEDRRVRCFAMYGVDKALIRIVVCNEERLNEIRNNDQTGSQNTDDMLSTSGLFTARDLVEMRNDVDRLVDKITANMDQQTMPSSPSIEVNQGRDGIKISPSSNTEPSSNTPSRWDQLGARMSMSGTDGTGSQKLSPHDMSLLELSSGVWLGDAIVRDIPNVATSSLGRGKGFGSSQPLSSSSGGGSVNTQSSRGSFAGWARGVQKVALRWMWNFGDEIRKVVDVGKALGSPLDDSLAKSLGGSVCVDESLSRRIPKSDRMVYIDLAQDMVAFLLGPYAIQVPRYITFDTSSSRTPKPFYTEFSIFQSVPTDDLTVGGATSKSVMDMSDDDVQNLPDVVCSKICRLYDFEGKLKQGSTSFYTLRRFGLDNSDET